MAAAAAIKERVTATPTHRVILAPHDSKPKEKVPGCISSTGHTRRVFYGMIPQCYLPSGRGDIPPEPQPIKAGTRFATPERCKAELS